MKEHKPLVFLAGMGMELSWRYAWATFLTTSLLHQQFPYPEAIGAFALAALLTSLHHERGWRVILILCLQLVGFIPAVLRIIYIFNSWSESFLSHALKSYVNALGQQEGVPLEWFVCLLVVFWAYLFWGGGVQMVKRPRDYVTICSRFDFGIMAFFFLFLVKFYLMLTGGSKIHDPDAEYLLFSFFIFGLSAIGLAQYGNRSANNFLPGYRGIGIILSFITVVVLFGGGLVFFGLPYLTGAAKIGYSILKSAAAPALSLLMIVARLLFGDDFSMMPKQEPPVKKIVTGTSKGPTGWWWQFFGQILYWLIIILLALVALALLSAIAFSVFQWLFSKTPAGQKKQSPWDILRLWVVKLQVLLHSCRRAMAKRMKGYTGIEQLYGALLGWGRRSGLPRYISETPNEYSLRLKDRFPSLRGDIELIVESFNREVYGEISHNERQIAMTRSAFRRLCSPVLWVVRMKAWFRRPLDQAGSSH